MTPVLAALLFFGVVHTFMAGRFKPFFRQRFGERDYHGLYRIIYNVVSVVTLIPVALTMGGDSRVVWQFGPSAAPILMVIQGMGLVGLAISLLQIDLLRFAGLRQLLAYLNDEPLPLPDETLQTGGIFRLVRHPLYLFSLLTTWPVQTMTVSYLAFCFGVTAYFMLGSILEERRLEAAFGDAYRRYRQEVPWLLPLPRPRSIA